MHFMPLLCCCAAALQVRAALDQQAHELRFEADKELAVAATAHRKEVQQLQDQAAQLAAQHAAVMQALQHEQRHALDTLLQQQQQQIASMKEQHTLEVAQLQERAQTSQTSSEAKARWATWFAGLGRHTCH